MCGLGIAMILFGSDGVAKMFKYKVSKEYARM